MSAEGGEARPFSAAADRNGPPLLAALQALLPPTGLLLEVASGTGQHAARFAAGLPGWRIQPTEADPALLSVIADWTAGLPNVLPPRRLDLLACASEDPAATVDAVFCANLIHIAPWPCTGALMGLAARSLRAGGLLLTYGPYLEDAVPTAPSNLDFDASLRARNPAWGLRRREAVEGAAARVGLHLSERLLMPANNLLLVWRGT